MSGRLCPVLISNHSTKNNCITIVDGSNFQGFTSRDLSCSFRGQGCFSMPLNLNSVGFQKREAPRDRLIL